jgi:hypothetical protein
MISKLATNYKIINMFINDFKKKFNDAEIYRKEDVIGTINRICNEIIRKFDQGKIWRFNPNLKEIHLNLAYV